MDDVDIRLRIEDQVREVTGLKEPELSMLSNRVLILCLQGGWWEQSETRREERERLLGRR